MTVAEHIPPEDDMIERGLKDRFVGIPPEVANEGLHDLTVGLMFGYSRGFLRGNPLKRKPGHANHHIVTRKCENCREFREMDGKVVLHTIVTFLGDPDRVPWHHWYVDEDRGSFCVVHYGFSNNPPVPYIYEMELTDEERRLLEGRDLVVLMTDVAGETKFRPMPRGKAYPWREDLWGKHPGFDVPPPIPNPNHKG